jgi:excinuclease ABC subunit C
MVNKARLLEQLKMVPVEPGVYIYHDADGKVIYVGKAKVLRARMRSYFQSGAEHTAKTKALVERIADFEFYVTASEVEALILECNLIKKFRPAFNILYRDDKSFPYIAITWKDEYPRLIVTRENHRKGTKYYGPYTGAQAVRETFNTLRRIFPFRMCKRSKPGRSGFAPCLNYHIKRCLGPCIGAVSPGEYRAILKQVELFLEGRPEVVVGHLEEQMKMAAENLEFEQAAKIRDRLEAAHQVLQRQKIVSEAGEDFDALGLSFENSAGCVNLSKVRGGKLIGSENFILSRLNKGDSAEDLLHAFLTQYYGNSIMIPPLVLIPAEIEDRAVIEEWLGRLRNTRVVLKVPKRGNKAELVEMAAANAEHALAMSVVKHSWEKDASERTLKALAEALSLNKIPDRIECFDISTIQGSNSVGSMVVFKEGKPAKTDYRKFKVHYDVGINDFAMMHEVITRRFGHMCDGMDRSFTDEPDLVVVDGGKGQLSAALEAMKEIGIAGIPVVGLAKREEEIFIPGESEPIRLDRGSDALRLMQRIRDEAHRFAITYHRSLRRKAMVESTLDSVPGVGDNRRRMLLKYFGSPSAIAGASLEELKTVPGLPGIIAERVYRHFNQPGGLD